MAPTATLEQDLKDLSADDEPKLIKDEDWAKDLVTIVQHFDRADQDVRERQVREWRKSMLYWDHIQYLWWSEVAHDWRTPDQARLDSLASDEYEIDPSLYAKVVNVYRAHGEVIIAAMAASSIKTVFEPEDAENSADLATAKSYNKLAVLVHKHNYSELLQIKALFILYNQGLVAGYNENAQSEEYGQIAEPEMGEVPVQTDEYLCPNCAESYGTETFELPDVGEDEEPSPEEAAHDASVEAEANVHQANNSAGGPPIQCVACGYQGPSEVDSFQDVAQKQVGEILHNKCREVLSVWGPLNVKVPAWIKRLKDSPYLMLETEEHFAYLQEVYAEAADFIAPSDEGDRHDRSARTPSSYYGDNPRDLQTCRRVWLRPWAYNVLAARGGQQSDDTRARVVKLRDMFPKGVYVVIIGDDLPVEAVPDTMDDHWTLTHHPLSDGIHAKSLGSPEIPVQEMTNELANLTLESIEHQIPEVYVHADAIDWDSYRKSEARPGMNYPANKPPGEALGNSFYEVKGGSLSREVEAFTERIERFGQFVVGALPSVFGGTAEGGSNTAREYELSRTQALQRLSLTWKLVVVWWVQMTEKAVRSYAANMIGDEQYVDDRGGGNYVNVWIRQAQMEGKVGQATAEGAETLPINWNQKRDVLLNLISLKDENIGAVLTHPENANFIQRLIGLPELYVPGDKDRTKQLLEISRLTAEAPQEQLDPMMPPEIDLETGLAMPAIKEVSSIPIDPELDDHFVEKETCACWLKSEVGLWYKENEPGAYLNVLLHFKEHNAQWMMMQAAQVAAESTEENGEKDNNEVEPFQ